MHVLPLPFGMALALLPRREMRRLRPDPAPIRLERSPAYRERVLSDLRYADVRQHIV